MPGAFFKNKVAQKMQHHPLENLLADEAGVTAIEYALLSSLIVVVILGAVGAVGSSVLSLWRLVSNCVTFAATGAGSCS